MSTWTAKLNFLEHETVLLKYSAWRYCYFCYFLFGFHCFWKKKQSELIDNVATNYSLIFKIDRHIKIRKLILKSSHYKMYLCSIELRTTLAFKQLKT